MFTEADMLSLADVKQWSVLPRIARTVPFGYVIDENDPDLLQPVPLELEALEKAKVHLRQFGYREVADWLSKVTGRYISHMGLKKRLDNERKRKNSVRFLEQLADRLEETRTKIEKAKTQHLGAYTTGDPSNSDPE